jgi:peptide/nickel transport system ATP-binding protein
MSQPVLSVDTMSVVFGTRKGPVTAVDGISFDVAAGETLGLIGESGSGKSATGLAIMNLLDASATRVARGITLDGERLDTLEPRAMNARRGASVAMIFQDPMTALNPVLRIGEQMAEATLAHAEVSRARARALAAEGLGQVGIPDPSSALDAYPHQFSGGMRQRVCIAIALLANPKLIIADEPTTALDTLVQQSVLDLLTRLTRERGAALLLISHNLPLVAHYASRGIVMYRGRIVEQGPMVRLLSAPVDAYTRALVDALPKRRRDPPPSLAPPVAEARRASITFSSTRGLFRGRRTVAAVVGVDLAVAEGETVALVGASGSGKSTLGRLMLRLHDGDGGAILFGGTDVTRARGRALAALRGAAQMIFQDPYASLNPRQRVLDIVEEPLAAHGEGHAASRQARALAMLRDVGLADHADRLPVQLSGGQRQRVAIARALVRDPRFVVADEPVSALDMTIQKQVLDLWRRLQATRGFACLFISHDLAAVGAIADRIVVMQSGRIVEEGPRDRVLDAPEHPYTKALWAASFMDAAGTSPRT